MVTIAIFVIIAMVTITIIMRPNNLVNHTLITKLGDINTTPNTVTDTVTDYVIPIDVIMENIPFINDENIITTNKNEYFGISVNKLRMLNSTVNDGIYSYVSDNIYTDLPSYELKRLRIESIYFAVTSTDIVTDEANIELDKLLLEIATIVNNVLTTPITEHVSYIFIENFIQWLKTSNEHIIGAIKINLNPGITVTSNIKHVYTILYDYLMLNYKMPTVDITDTSSIIIPINDIIKTIRYTNPNGNIIKDKYEYAYSVANTLQSLKTPPNDTYNTFVIMDNIYPNMSYYGKCEKMMNIYVNGTKYDASLEETDVLNTLVLEFISIYNTHNTNVLDTTGPTIQNVINIYLPIIIFSLLFNTININGAIILGLDPSITIMSNMFDLFNILHKYLTEYYPSIMS